MAATEWLAPGNTADQTLELTIADGESSTISAFRTDGEPLDPGDHADLLIKASDGEYNPTGFSLTRESPTLTIASVGIYVLKRGISSGSFGADYNGGTLGGA